jgi:hypothetical protein
MTISPPRQERFDTELGTLDTPPEWGMGFYQKRVLQSKLPDPGDPKRDPQKCDPEPPPPGYDPPKWDWNPSPGWDPSWDPPDCDPPDCDPPDLESESDSDSELSEWNPEFPGDSPGGNGVPSRLPEGVPRETSTPLSFQGLRGKMVSHRISRRCSGREARLLESSESYISSKGVNVNRCFRYPSEATGGGARAPGRAGA